MEKFTLVPHPLPPDPPPDIDGDLGTLLDAASTALGRLDGISSLLPDPRLFLHTYVRKEAVLSSQIEGTQSSLSDLLRHEIDGTPTGSTPAPPTSPSSTRAESRFDPHALAPMSAEPVRSRPHFPASPH